MRRVQVAGRSVSSGMDTVYALDINKNEERKRKMGIRQLYARATWPHGQACGRRKKLESLH